MNDEEILLAQFVRTFADKDVRPSASDPGPADRYLPDAPLMIVGEATNEIQRNIVKQLVQRAGVGS